MITSSNSFSHFHSALCLLLGFTLFFAFLIPQESLHLLVLCAFICAISLVPLYFCDNKSAIFSPFTLIFALVFFSSLGKLLFLLFTTDQEEVYSFLQLDSNLYALYSGIFILSLFIVAYSSTILFLYGAILKSTKSCINFINKSPSLQTKNSHTLLMALLFFFFLSIVFFILFLKINNIDLFNSPLSAKRLVDIDGGLGNRINSYSYWLYKSVFIVKASFYISILFVLNNRSVSNLTMVFIVYCYLIFLATFFSNRTELLFATAELSIIFFTLNKKQIYALITFLVVTVVLYLVISILRANSLDNIDPLNNLLGKRYLSGIDKLGIMHDYFLESPIEHSGKSLIGIIGLVVPYYSEGVYAYFNLFRQTIIFETYAVIRSGAPPGAIIEVFANFRYFGVVVLGAFFGVLMTFLHCLLLNSKNKLILLITFAVVVRVCFLFMNSNFIIGFLRAVIDIGPFVLIVLILYLLSNCLKNINYTKN